MKYFLSIFIICFIWYSNTLAQGEAAVPFLLIQPSPALNGMAGAYTALPTNSAYGFYYNPAQAGSFAAEENFSVEACRVEWLPGFQFSDLYYKSEVGAAGYNFRHSQAKLPLSLGFGFMHNYLNLGENVWTDETGQVLGVFSSYEEYTTISVGLQWNWLVRLALGIGAKNFHSKLSSINVGSEKNGGRANGWAYDTGILARLPVFENWPLVLGTAQDATFFPVLDLNLGLAQLNAGKKVSYTSSSGNDPLPLQAKIGFSIVAGIDMQVDELRLNVARITFSSEANDMLIKSDAQGSKSYGFFPGEINPYTHVLRAQSDSHVLNRHGHRLDFLETLSLSQGNFSGNHFGNVNTEGYRFSSRGLAKFFAPTIKNKWARLILTHMDVAYNYSEYKTKHSPLSGTNFKSFSLNIFGF